MEYDFEYKYYQYRDEIRKYRVYEKPIDNTEYKKNQLEFIRSKFPKLSKKIKGVDAKNVCLSKM